MCKSHLQWFPNVPTCCPSSLLTHTPKHQKNKKQKISWTGLCKASIQQQCQHDGSKGRHRTKSLSLSKHKVSPFTKCPRKREAQLTRITNGCPHFESKCINSKGANTLVSTSHSHGIWQKKTGPRGLRSYF